MTDRIDHAAEAQLRSSSPPRKGRHPRVRSPPRADRIRLRSSSPPRKGRHSGVQAYCWLGDPLRSSSPPRKGRHACGAAAIPNSGMLRSSSPPRKGRHDATIGLDGKTYKLRSSSPPRKGRHAGRIAAGSPVTSCDPRPLRGRDATSRRGRPDDRSVVAILVPSEEGTPHDTQAVTVGDLRLLRSSSPPRKGRHLTPSRGVVHESPLRSSSPPRKGRHRADAPRRPTPHRCDPRPLRGRDATRKRQKSRSRRSGCDPRPLRGRDATLEHLPLRFLHRVAILVPSEEGTPRRALPGSVPVQSVAILVPSEEGTPPCLSRSPSIVHRVFRRICG